MSQMDQVGQIYLQLLKVVKESNQMYKGERISNSILGESPNQIQTDKRVGNEIIRKFSQRLQHMNQSNILDENV